MNVSPNTQNCSLRNTGKQQIGFGKFNGILKERHLSHYDIKKMAIMQCVWVQLRTEQAKKEAETNLTGIAKS